MAAHDVLHVLRSGTAAEHQDVERTLNLLDPALGRRRLTDVLTRMHGFWLAAEAGLDAWAARHPSDAHEVQWPARRRAHLFADDLRALGADHPATAPALPRLTGTDQALGRLYVREGSTLGGTFIDRHLAGLPELSGVCAFSHDGARTGAMWHGFRRVVRGRVREGGDPAAILGSARGTFRALADWCRPLAGTA